MRRRAPVAIGLAVLVATGCQVAGVAPGVGSKPKATATPRATGAPSATPGPTSAPTATPGLAPPAVPATYFGRVLQPDGTPATGILVRGFLLSDQGSGVVSNNSASLISDQGTGYVLAQATSLETRTAADGTFKLADPQGRPINLEAVASDELKAFRPAVASTAQGVDLTLAPTGSLSGVVKAAGVTDLIGADVFIPGTSYVAKTDGAGRYSIANVPVGTFEVYATKPGLGKASAQGVAVKSRVATAVADLLLVAEKPTITAVEPAAAGPGATVTLKGNAFAAAVGDTFQVTLAGAVLAGPERIDGGTIRFKVPAEAKSGDLVVAVGGLQGNPMPFKVLPTLGSPVLVRDLVVGERLALRPFGVDTAGERVAGPPLTWTAGAGAVTVDATGTVTGARVGAAEVVAASGDTKLSLAFQVHATAANLLVTLAGAAIAGNADGAGGDASLRFPTGVDWLDDHTLVFTDYGNHNVRTVDLTDPTLPVIETIAGGPGRVGDEPWDGPTVGGYKDGPAREARFSAAFGGAPDGQGGYLVMDMGNERIRRVAGDGTVTTFAGSGTKGNANGPALSATFDFPNNVVVAPNGVVYVGESNNTAIRMIEDGEVSNLAGQAASPGDVDGPGASARFKAPNGLLLDGRGGLLVIDGLTSKIRRVDLVDPAHPVTTFAGSVKGYADGVGTAAKFEDIGDLALAPDGAVYVADLQAWDDGYSSRIRKILPDGTVTTVFDSQGLSGLLDGPVAGARLGRIGDLVVSKDGKSLYFFDSSRQTSGTRLRQLRL